ncbi:MAG: hypothetical protein U9R08_05510 [Nanoarchaeota archaeon]|nr:hypothetical protein [Nanoarchaeota archaeon]
MKKGQGLPLNTIVIAVIVMIVAVVLIFIFRTQIQKEGDFISGQIDSLGDCDCDGAANFIDDCDFDPNIQTKKKDQSCGSGIGTKKEDCLDVKAGGSCPPK